MMLVVHSSRRQFTIAFVKWSLYFQRFWSQFVQNLTYIFVLSALRLLITLLSFSSPSSPLTLSSLSTQGLLCIRQVFFPQAHVLSPVTLYLISDVKWENMSFCI